MNQDERLKLSATLGDYKITEVVLVHVPLSDIGQRHQPSRHQQPAAPSPPSTPTTLTTPTSPAPSDDMSNKKAQVAYTNSTNTMSGSTTRLSGQSGAKSALRSTTSEAALNHAGEKKRRGLLGLFGFGKHKKGSVIAVFLIFLFH